MLCTDDLLTATSSNVATIPGVDCQAASKVMASVGCCRRRMYIQDCKTSSSYNVLYVPYLYRLHVGIAASAGLGIRGVSYNHACVVDGVQTKDVQKKIRSLRLAPTSNR